MKKALVLITVIMTLMNCSSNNDASKTKPNSISSVSVQELKAKADSGNNFLLLDVRTAPEFLAGRLSFTDKLIPYDSMQKYLDSLPQDKTTPIYCFCRSGRRSAIASTFLQSVGYTNVHNVTGGIIAWQDAEYDIVSGPVNNNK